MLHFDAERRKPSVPCGTAATTGSDAPALAVDREADRAQIEATIQKRRMIFVSDHAFSSKWWWIGAIRNTRLRVVWKEITWITTDSASITKIPPSRISSTSVLVITASPAIAPPSPSEPVSPMKIVAGKALNQRKPMHAPTRQPASIARSKSPREEGDADVGEQHDRRAARGQPVEPVGQVDGARRARDDEVDQHRIEGPEVDVVVDEAQQQRRRQVRLLRARSTTGRARSRS